MKTDDLIQSLSGDLKPAPRDVVARRLALGLGAGAVVSVAIIAPWLGLRPDLAQAVLTPMFWIKFTYAAAAGLLLALAASRLSRPGARLGGLAVAVGLPFALMATMGGMRLAKDGQQKHTLCQGDILRNSACFRPLCRRNGKTFADMRATLRQRVCGFDVSPESVIHELVRMRK